MRARVGDLAIIRFDPSEEDKSNGKRWDEKVGVVTECQTILHEPTRTHNHVHTSRDYSVMYWTKIGNRIEVNSRWLPLSRLVRARPKRDDWEGTLSSLTLDNVEPVR